MGWARRGGFLVALASLGSLCLALAGFAGGVPFGQPVAAIFTLSGC